jgi:hypothetical protein
MLKKRLFGMTAIIAGAMFVFSFAACDDGNGNGGGGGGNGDDGGGANIVGTWKGSGYTYVFTETEYTLDKGSGEIEEKGTYSVSGNTATLRSTHTDEESGTPGELTPDTSFTRIGTINGNTMAMSLQGLPGYSVTLTKQ